MNEERELIETDERGTEILYVTLHETEPDSCDGEELSLVYTKVLEAIRDTTPGERRNAMVRHFASLVAQRRFCKYHWLAIDRLLHQLITIWRQPVQRA
jgi:hypothetical protein